MYRPSRLVKGEKDLVITENAVEEALGTHAGPWPFDNNSRRSASNKSKSPFKRKPLAEPKDKKKLTELLDNINTLAQLAPLSTTNYKSTKGSTTARDRDSIASISPGKMFVSRNRSVATHADQLIVNPNAERKQPPSAKNMSSIQLSKTQFRRNILSNIFSNTPYRKSSLTQIANMADETLMNPAKARLLNQEYRSRSQIDNYPATGGLQQIDSVQHSAARSPHKSSKTSLPKVQFSNQVSMETLGVHTINTE